MEGTAVMGAEPCASMSFPVEVYNCAMGSPDCSQCLGREDLGHLCVWSDSCRLRGPLQPLPGACPAPEIRAVSTPPPPPWKPLLCSCTAHVLAHALHTHALLPVEHLGARPLQGWRHRSEQNQVPALTERMFSIGTSEEISHIQEAASTRRKAAGQGPGESGGGDAGRSVSSVIATAGDMVTAEDASHSQASVLIKKKSQGMILMA